MVKANFEATLEDDVEPSTDEHTMLEALRFIARHHGVHLSREQLVRQYVRRPGEVGSGMVVAAAEKAGLKAKITRMRFDQLLRLGRAVPVLLRLRDGTARVLITSSESSSPPIVVLRHPLDGSQPQPFDLISLSEIWDGETILFKRKHAAATDNSDFSLGWLMHQIGKDRVIFRDVGLAAFCLSIFALVQPMMYFVVVDRIVVHQRMSTLFVLIIGIIFATIFDTAFGYLRRWLIAEGTSRTDARINTYIFDRLIGLPIEVFEQNSTGIIAHKLNEANRVRQFLTGQAFTTLLDSTVLLVLLPVMFYMHATLTFFVLAVAIVMFVVIMIFLPALGRAHARLVTAEQRKGSLLVETIYGMRTVKTLALEGRRRNQWDEAASAAVVAHRDLNFLTNIPQTLLQPLEKLIYSGSLLIGCYMALTATDGAVGIGPLLAFSMLASRVTQPFVQIAGLLQLVQEVRGAILQVSSMVNIPAEDTRSTHGLRPRFFGAISFDDIRFRYAGSQNYALDRVTFSLPPGSVTGVMGRSGSGKTTLTRMLQGLHQDYDGLIKIDGVDLRQMDITHLRANLGVVLQENFLFSGSIRENIGIARPDATFEAIIEAARLAGAEEFIERMPAGYDTVLTEGASNLSGGQRQRLAIARALLVDPTIMILDEATSALDPDSEAIVNNNLRHIAKGRTMIVISHRLASLVDCDQIIVMERGQVIDIGTHDELVVRCPIYRHLWFQQNRHQSPSSTGTNANERSITGPAS